MSPLRLSGVRAVVTGASRGIGRVIAEAYLREGAILVVTARELAHLDALERSAAGQPGRVARTVALELGDPASVRAAAHEARTELGRVDVIVNNAAVLGERGPLSATHGDALIDALAINVAGPVGLVAELRDALADDAVIINVTSGAAGRARWGTYGLTKAALNIASQMLADEFAACGVRCVAINPGGVRTQMRSAAYPAEDPASVPHPRSVAEPFIAIAAGAPAHGIIEAREWDT
jgi:NAD(P)-dependent dehydrogenase (short-subunit alcohol dehydrogenase family)